MKGRAVGYFKCCQNADILKRTSTEVLIRQSNPAPAFNCAGSLTITLHTSGRIEFGVRHAFVHAVPGPKTVSEAVLSFVEANSELPSSQIFRLLKKKEAGVYPEMSYITSSQIYYHHAELQTCKYKRDDDPLKSAILLLEEESEVDLMQSSSTDYTALAFLTPLSRTTGGAGQNDRSYFVDSTCEHSDSTAKYAGVKFFNAHEDFLQVS